MANIMDNLKKLKPWQIGAITGTCIIGGYAYYRNKSTKEEYTNLPSIEESPSSSSDSGSVGSGSSSINNSPAGTDVALSTMSDNFTTALNNLSSQFKDSLANSNTVTAQVEATNQTLVSKINTQDSQIKELQNKPITIAGNNIDIARAKERFGNNPNYVFVDNTATPYTPKKGDIVLGGTGAVGGYAKTADGVIRVGGKNRDETLDNLTKEIGG